MDYVIELLETQKKQLSRNVINQKLMQKDIRKGISELSKITEITKAIKVLKTKRYKYQK
ncbi:hypothetical protein [Aquimarina sp. 2201CG5-10]|uniref:hypothetical protein n=1 Tax=Aquimarina callyspongiae TaxID=3098150 RepID=UPI002AB35758|nr:hypothetical protein [Aquimarina sp. 2201CG5-10]MDY8136617.1 hypothetical protein [Aquimarina sp. 2201CG5-10]